MQKCPKCGEDTISKFDKLMLGPGRTILCNKCKSKISVSWWTWVFFVLILLSTRIINQYMDPQITFVLTLILMGGYLYIHYRFVPLELRRNEDEN